LSAGRIGGGGKERETREGGGGLLVFLFSSPVVGGGEGTSVLIFLLHALSLYFSPSLSVHGRPKFVFLCERKLSKKSRLGTTGKRKGHSFFKEGKREKQRGLLNTPPYLNEMGELRDVRSKRAMAPPVLSDEMSEKGGNIFKGGKKTKKTTSGQRGRQQRWRSLPKAGFGRPWIQWRSREEGEARVSRRRRRQQRRRSRRGCGAGGPSRRGGRRSCWWRRCRPPRRGRRRPRPRRCGSRCSPRWPSSQARLSLLRRPLPLLGSRPPLLRARRRAASEQGPEGAPAAAAAPAHAAAAAAAAALGAPRSGPGRP